MTTAPVSEHDILTLVHATWGSIPSQGGGVRYLVAEHVNDGAGFGYQRTLDAIVFDTWPSKGLTLHGIEVKVTTSDFRRELQTPEKSARFIEKLDLFSIAAPLGVVDLELLPARWGLYCPDGQGKLRARRKPLPLCEGKPLPTIPRSLAAAFGRALLTRSLSAQVLEETRRTAFEQATKTYERERKNLQHDLDTLRASVDAFEKASGVAIGTFRYGEPERLGRALATLLSGASDWRIKRLREDGEALIAIADTLADVLPTEAAVTS